MPKYQLGGEKGKANSNPGRVQNKGWDIALSELSVDLFEIGVILKEETIC